MAEIPVDDGGDTTGIIVHRRAAPAAPGTYFETLCSGVTAWFEHLAMRAIRERRGLPEETSEQFLYRWDPMSYETNQQKVCEVWRDGRLRCVISISVYRMPSGRYEVNAYLS